METVAFLFTTEHYRKRSLRFLLLVVFFFVIPLAQKVEILKFLTFESRLGEIEQKQAEHGEEIKQLKVPQCQLRANISHFGAEH